MNLGIEYLIRTGAIKEFFSVPCSLCVEHWQGAKVAIGIEESFGRSSFLVTHWNLEEPDEDSYLPKSEIHHVPKDQIFSNEKVVLNGFSLLPYAEQPIITAYNRYSHPMDDITYREFYRSLLSSKQHQIEREVWLWKSFMKLHVPRPVLSLFHYEDRDRTRIVMLEQRIVHERYTKKWGIWRDWRSRMLLTGKVAPELIFYAAYH